MARAEVTEATERSSEKVENRMVGNYWRRRGKEGKNELEIHKNAEHRRE
jgi:hypothetical protein